MADIKITGVDDAASNETTSQWGGPKIRYSVSSQPNQDWQNEFNRIWPQTANLNNAIRRIDFSAMKMTVECSNDIDPDLLKNGLEQAVSQANQKLDTFHKKLGDEKF